LFEDPHATDVAASTLINAIALAKYYAQTALRLHGAGQVNVKLVTAEALLQWLQSKWAPKYGTKIGVAEVVKFGPNATRDTATVRELINILESHRHLKRVSGSAEVIGRTRREVWEIQERIFEGAAAEPAEPAEERSSIFHFRKFRNFRTGA
jgi:hypothetical protein